MSMFLLVLLSKEASMRLLLFDLRYGHSLSFVTMNVGGHEHSSSTIIVEGGR